MALMIAAEAKTETSERRTGVGIDRETIAVCNRVPCPVVRFQVNLGNRWNFRQHSGADLIDHLLDASRFERSKSVVNQIADLGRRAAFRERGFEDVYVHSRSSHMFNGRS